MNPPATVRCVPGLGLGTEAWQPTLSRLDVPGGVALLPGYGRPAPRGTDLSPARLATILVQNWLSPDRPVILAGHSASCQIVVEAAVRAPECVAGLVLVGPTTDPRAASWSALARRWLATARHEPPRQVPALVRQYARTGPATMRNAMAQAKAHDVEVVLAAVACPVLLVRGRQDRICPEDWLTTLLEAARERVSSPTSARQVSLPVGGHMVPLTHGDLVADAVRDFATTIDRSRRR